MSAQVLEEDLEFDMTSVESLHDERLLPKLAKLRDCDPVHWSKTNRCWQITTYEDVAAAFQDARFSNVRMSTYAFRICGLAPPAVSELVLRVDRESH